MYTIPIICLITACGLDGVPLGTREPWDNPPSVNEHSIPYSPSAACGIRGEFYERCPENAADLQYPGWADENEENDRHWTRD